MTEERVKRKLSAILSADVVGYSRLMGEDEVSTVRTLEAYRKVMSDLIEQFRGRVVDSPGDNLLAEFGSVVDAVQCAVEIHEVIRAKNEELSEDRRMLFRIGVNLGDVIEEGDRIYGDGVNIAARLEGLAEAGGICISGSAHEQIKNKLALGYEYIGEHTVKNITEPLKVYKVPIGPKAAASKDGDEKKTRLKNWQWTALGAAGAIIVIIAALTIWNLYLRGPSIEPELPLDVSEVEEGPKTIAVIPFVNLSSDPEQEYFVDGLSEELLNSLTKIPDLLVTARTSSFAFKGTDKKVQEIANELGVAHILEGSVRKADNSIRITAQLIRAADGFHLWSEIYDQELKDIFAVQEHIATAVANELKSALGIGKYIKQLGGTDNPEAYELYLIGQGQLQRYAPHVDPALESINAAIALDPEFALAWALKPLIHYYRLVFEPVNQANAEQDAGLSAALKAIELEPNLADGYNSLGYIQSSRGEFIEAESSYNKGLELANDTFKFIYRHYFAVGYFDKALEVLKEMVRKDPLNQELRGSYLSALGLTGNMQRAEEEYDRGKALFGDKWVWGEVNIIDLRLDTDHFISRDRILRLNPDDEALSQFLESPEDGLAELHRKYDDIPVRKYFRNLSSKDYSTIWMYAAYFGDLEFSMDAMEKGLSINSFSLQNAWYPIMKEVRQTPRFKKLIREIGLVDYWNKFGWPDICRPLDNGDFECD